MADHPTGPEVAMDVDDEASIDSVDDLAREEDVWLEAEINAVENDMQQTAAPSELRNDIASLMYMSNVKSLFHDLFLNKQERLTAGNIDAYVEHAKYCLTYFETWKLAQLQRKKLGDKNWNKSFLAHQTYKNLRMSVCVFFTLQDIW